MSRADEQRKAAERILAESYANRPITSDEEILLRLQVAKEIVDDAYDKYLKNPEHTREEVSDFLDFVIEFNDFCRNLRSETE